MPLWTVEKKCEAALEERKSRFLAHLVPIAEFDRMRSDLKKKHRKANHHVTAYRTMRSDNRIEEGAKDDGEPAGTSGMPVLKVLQGRAIVDAGVIVVRYFGGIKLGGGGLARAYSGAAARAVDVATLVPWTRIVEKTLTCSFPDVSALEAQIAALDLKVADRQFSENGQTLIVTGPEGQIEKLMLPGY